MADSKDTKETKDTGRVDKELWAQAEHAASNQTGGFSGVGAEGKKIQIQKQYDQMVANDKATKEWAGDSGILGDV